MAVPDGASIFWSWCSSMISAVSKHGAASSAKRIISTAPMAKFGAMTQLLFVNRSRSGPRRGRSKPVVPTTAWMPTPASQRQVLAGGVDLGEVDDHVDLGVEQGLGAGGQLQRQVEAGRPGAGRARRGTGRRRDQLEVGVVGDRLAHRGAHAPAGAEHTDPDHRA